MFKDVHRFLIKNLTKVKSSVVVPFVDAVKNEVRRSPKVMKIFLSYIRKFKYVLNTQSPY